MKLKVLLDSTYILPTFGIVVEGLTNEDIKMLKELARDKVEYYCASIIWIEVLGKVHKEALRHKIDVDDLVQVAIDSLMNSGLYRWVEPTPDAIKIAFELRRKGHKDMIDNILYGIAKSENMIFLTMDTELVAFLKSNNYNTENLLDHTKLFKIITNK